MAVGGWIIFSRRFIIRSCSCRHWTWRRFCWCMARRTSLHVSSMARLDLFCCCNMACITRSFFLFMDRCLLERLFLADVGCELGEQRMDLLEQAAYCNKRSPLGSRGYHRSYNLNIKLKYQKHFKINGRLNKQIEKSAVRMSLKTWKCVSIFAHQVSLSHIQCSF